MPRDVHPPEAAGTHDPAEGKILQAVPAATPAGGEGRGRSRRGRRVTGALVLLLLLLN